LPFSSDVTQLNKKLNKNLLTNNKHNLTTRSRREVMKPFEQRSYGDKPISPTLQELKCLNLTKSGQIRLTPFPDEAILDAASSMKHAKNVRDPFNWFFKLCLEYCHRNEIAPDWPYMHTLIEKYKIKPDMPPLKTTHSVQDGLSRSADKQSTVVYKPSTSGSEQKVLSTTERMKIARDLENSIPKQSREERIAYLEKEIHAYTEQLVDPSKFFNAFLIELHIKRTEGLLKNCLDEWNLLRV
jgi:hypothetical protein